MAISYIHEAFYTIAIYTV